MPAPKTLAALEADAARDIELTAHPRPAWLEPKTRGGAPVLDVLIIGGGQCALATAFALKRDRVDNLLCIDRAPFGKEGPWSSFARMRWLRSLKDQTGPDLRTPSLCYQAWHEAQFGADDFAAMHMIPTALWADYLLWFRRVTGIPVRNGVTAGRISPARTDDGLPCLAVETSEGPMHARKVVIATGQEGVGAWWMPDFLDGLPRGCCAHAAQAIDFRALRGKVVAVLGAGASAFDNAAVALEHGAAEVHLFCRRPIVQDIQPYRWISFTGFLRNLFEMPDAWRWRFMHRVLTLREGFAQDTYDRAARHTNFTMHVGRPWTGARVEDGRLVLETPRGEFHADFAIAGTGVRMDPALAPELAGCAHNIALWRDRYTPPAGEESERLGEFPYLNPDYSFAERVPGETPWLRDIHLFGIGATMSFGPSGASINAMSIAAPRLAAGITKGLFEADMPRLWREFEAFDIKQVVLDPARTVGV